MDYFGDINVYGLNSKIHLNCNPNADHPFNGFVCNDKTTPNVKYGDILYYNVTMGMWDLACADDVNKLPARGIACADYSLLSDRMPILMFGFFFWQDKYDPLIRSQIWLSDNIPGGFTDSQPTTLNNYCQTLGMAKTQSIFFFDFCPFYIQIG